jgi:hypothetical protein
MYYLTSSTCRLGTKAKMARKQKIKRQLTQAPTSVHAGLAAGRQKLLERHRAEVDHFPW